MVCAFTFLSCGYIWREFCAERMGVHVVVFRGIWVRRALAFGGRRVVVRWCCRCIVWSWDRLGVSCGSSVVLGVEKVVGDGDRCIGPAVLYTDVGGGC